MVRIMSRFRIALVILVLLPLPAFGQTPEQALKEGLELREKGEVYFEQGLYVEALPLAQRAVSLLEQALGPDHEEVARALNNLGLQYKSLGDYAKAETVYQRSLRIAEKVLGPDHPHVAVALTNLAKLYAEMADYKKAITLHMQALRIREKAFGTESPEAARSLLALGMLFRDAGDYENAEAVCLSSLRIAEKALGPNHIQVAYILRTLALVYDRTGKKSSSLYVRALKIMENSLRRNHPVYLETLNFLAFSFGISGDNEAAERIFNRVLAIRERELGADHPQMATAIQNLAYIDAARRDYGAAYRSFQKALSIEDKLIQNVFAIATEEQKLKFIQSAAAPYLVFLSLVHKHLRTDPGAVRGGLELVLRRKGIVFDAQSRAREALQGRLSEAARKDFEKLSALRGELSRLLLNKSEKLTPEAYQEKITSLQQQIEAVEKRLADESALVAKELKQRTITAEAAAKALPKGAALVEFVKIGDFDFDKRTWTSTERYLAFVLTAAGDVTLVDLGEASELEKQARQAVEHIQASVRAVQQSRQSLAALHQAVWAPLKAALKDTDKVVISPDGQLNLVPFAALLDGEGKSLLERYRLAYVTSGRELIAATGAPIPPDSDLVLVANPAYDKKGTAAGNPGASRRSRNFRGSFDPLPGTELEAKTIPPLVAGKPDKKRIVVGTSATESAVKAARSPRILHLATHGFFLEDEVMPLDEDKKGAAPKIENPLVRSGLAFAGANHAAESGGDDDGILTALEITGMDLYGTELVVLSACETGVGEVKTGEGVYGLRRAFALAGAKNLMMSLWPVSDEVTASQMKTFYKNLQTMPPAEALRQAQLATITELKAKFGGQAPPVLWAPFFLQGAQALGQ